MHRRRDTLADLLIGVGVGLCAGVLYLRTSAPGVLGGDSGEFQFAAWLGGWVHPTGYPLYLILGYLWTHLVPLSDPAWRMNAFSALWGGVAVGLVYRLARRVLATHPYRRLRTAGASGRRCVAPCKEDAGPDQSGLGAVVHRLLALLAALTFAVTPTFWSQAVVAEVYTLHAAFVAALLWGLASWADQPDGRSRQRLTCGIALIYGLSLTHHRTMLLFAPAIAVFLWLAGGRTSAPPSPSVGEGGRGGEGVWAKVLIRKVRYVALPTTLVLLPLCLYLYTPLVAPHTPYTRVVLSPSQILELYDPTLAGFARYVTGQVFGADLSTTAQALARIVPAARMLAGEVSWVGVVLGLIGLPWLARRSRPFFALTGLGFIAVVVFNLFYGIGDIGVFYIPAFLLWSLWLACGVAALVRGLDVILGAGLLVPRRLVHPERTRSLAPCGRESKHPERSPALSAGRSRRMAAGLCLAVIALGLPVCLLFSGYTRIDQSRNDSARDTWEAILSQPIPLDAILLSNDRDEMMPLWYMQQVEGIRRDLTGLFPGILPTEEWADVGTVTESALASGRPVLLTKPMPGMEVRFRLEPVGAVVRVLGSAVEGEPARSSAAVFADVIRLVGYDVEPPMLAGSSVTVTLVWQSLQQIPADYTTFVHLVNADGEMVGQSDHRPGGIYYGTRLWRPGDRLEDVHVLPLAADLGRPPYALQVGLYVIDAELRHLGQPLQVGTLAQERAPDPIPADLAHPLDLSFGGEIALRGYEMDIEGDLLLLRLYWQALRFPSAAYARFIHVVDRAGMLVTQLDEQPVSAEFPTSAWPAGLTLADPMAVRLPPNLPPGEYQVIAGLYDAATMVRLAIRDAQGRPTGDSAVLGTLSWPLAR